MESIVLSIISSYLKEYVNNFRREQISVNFLQGQGVIRDLDINVDPFNDMIFSNVPAFRFLRIVINSLSIDAPFMSLKSQPIVVYIDEMSVEIVEIEDIVKKDPKKAKSKAASGGKYGFSDRVIDSIAFEVNKIFISVKTLGRFKTSQCHRGSPPVILLELCRNRFSCTNHNGVEADLDECIRVRLTKRPILFIYKRLISKSASVYLVNPMIWNKLSKAIRINIGSKKEISGLLSIYKILAEERPYVMSKIINEAPFSINLCFRKRIENRLLLGLEVCFRFPEKTRMTCKQYILGEFINCLYGIQGALQRKDAVEEVYGSNPHNEPGIAKFLDTLRRESQGSTSSSSSDRKPSSSTSSSSSSGGFSSFFSSRFRTKSSDVDDNKQIFLRQKLSKEELLRLTMMEDEIEKSATAAATAAEKLNEDSSNDKNEWDSDVDPPHMRFVLAFEVHDIIFTFSYNEVLTQLDSPTAATSSSSSQRLSSSSNSDKSNSKNSIRGVDLHITNLVFSSIWKETHMTTENTQQISFKTFHLTEFIGTSKICMMRSTLPIDHRGSNYIKLLPRGIKEFNQFDPETYSGSSFLYRNDSNWPPPPVHMGFGSKIDCVVGAFDFTFNFDSINNFMKFMKGAYDRPMNLFPKIDENTHTPGSTQICAMLYGIKCFLYSDFVDDNKTSKMPYSKTLIPSHVVFEIGLSSLAWKPSLDVKAFLRALGENTRAAPHKPTDLTNKLKAFKPVNEVDLLSDRFEASVSQICLKFADLNSKTTGNGSDSYRSLIKPFSIHYMISVDPHPEKDLILPPPESFFNPYNRVFYWEKGSSTITSHLISIDNFVVYCSLLDITRIININFLMYEWMQEFYPNGIFDMSSVPTERTDYEPANIILIVKISNIQFNLLQTDISKSKSSLLLASPEVSSAGGQSKSNSSNDKTNNAGPRPSLSPTSRGNQQAIDQKLMNFNQTVDMLFEIEFVTTVFEWIESEPTWSAETLIVKALIGTICHYVNESPAYFITHANTKDCFDMCWSMSSDKSKLMSKSPVVVMRYEATIDKSTTSSLASNKDADDFPILEFTVGQCTIDISKNVNIVAVTQPFEHMLETMIDQLLHGHGIIYSATGTTFDNCILGYWMKLAKYFYSVNFLERVPTDSISRSSSLHTSISSIQAAVQSSQLDYSNPPSSSPLSNQPIVSSDISSYLSRETLPQLSEVFVTPNDYRGKTGGDNSNINSNCDKQETPAIFAAQEEPLTIATLNATMDDVDAGNGNDATPSLIKSKRHKILEIIVRSEKLDLGLVDPFEKNSKYVAIGVSLDSGLVNGCFSPTLPQYFKSKMHSKQSLIFYHEGKDQPFEGLVFTTPFSLNGELKRSADGQYQLGWNSSLQNMFLNLDQSLMSNATEIVNRLATQIQMSANSVSSMLSAAKSKLDHENSVSQRRKSFTESSKSDLNDSSAEKDSEGVKSKTSLNMASGKIITMLLSSASNETNRLPIGVNRNDVLTQLDATTTLMDSIQKLTEDTTKQLASLNTKSESQYAESRAGIESASSLSSSLSGLCTRLSRMLAVLGAQTIIHCGFVRRSSNFSRSDRTVGSTRLWCTVNPTNMIFSSSPYSSKIDFEINLASKTVEVYDPDEGKEAEGKVSLTSKVWLRNSSLDGALLVLDFDTFDEKVIWIEALKPWLNEATAQRMREMRARSIMSLALGLNSSSSISAASSSQNSSHGGVHNNNAHGASDAGRSANLTLPDQEVSGERKGRFQSAATNMMKALSLSKKKDKEESKTESIKQQTTSGDFVTPIKSSISNSSSDETFDGNNYDENTSYKERQLDPETAKVFPHFVKSMIKDANEMQDLSAKFAARFSEILTKVDENMSSEKFNYKKSHDILTSLMISLIGLDTSVRDLSKSSLSFNDEGLAKISGLSKSLQTSISTCDSMTRLCKRQMQRKQECDSLLEAITIQNINTTIEMSKRYDDLMEYYNDQRYKETSGVVSNSVNIHESVKNLTTSLREVEKMLACSLETETMLNEEVCSTRFEMAVMQSQMPMLTQNVNDLSGRINSELTILTCEYSSLLDRKTAVQSERDDYKQKYEMLLQKFKEQQL